VCVCVCVPVIGITQKLVDGPGWNIHGSKSVWILPEFWDPSAISQKKHIDGFGRNFLGGEPDDSWVKKVTVRDQGRRQGV